MRHLARVRAGDHSVARTDTFTRPSLGPMFGCQICSNSIISTTWDRKSGFACLGGESNARRLHGVVRRQLEAQKEQSSFVRGISLVGANDGKLLVGQQWVGMWHTGPTMVAIHWRRLSLTGPSAIPATGSKFNCLNSDWTLLHSAWILTISPWTRREARLGVRQRRGPWLRSISTTPGRFVVN